MMTEDVSGSAAGTKLPEATTFKRGNAEELAFLDELAGVVPQKEADAAAVAAPAEQSAAEARSAAGAVIQELQKGNADELAFLDELAGVVPKVEAEGDKGIASTADATLSSAAGTSERAADTPGDPGTSQAGVDGISKDAEPEKKEEEEEETYERDATELLNAFKDDGKQAEETKDEVDTFQAFMNELRSVDRDNEVNRILWAFKLNPFEKMNLRFDATEAEVRKQYRKISLLIHPDKCSHPQASDAFEILQLAQKELLNEEVRTSLLRVLEFAREQVREERRKATKHDSALRMATYLHGKGREGVEEDWEKTDDFHEKWKMKSRDVLAKAEFRRRKLNKRIREEEERVQQEEQEEAKERKKQRKEKQQWLEKRTDRIGAWRDWTKGGKKGGGIKAPKIKTSDSDRSYVQRATTEQFVGNYKKKPPK